MCNVTNYVHSYVVVYFYLHSCSTLYEILPEFCEQYYNNVTFWIRLNNTTLKEALDSVKINVLSNASFNGTLMENVQRHLCFYYYPLCDTQTDDVIALCNGSCLILNDNPDYSVVINEVANELVSFDVEPPDDKCFKTFSEQSEDVPISQFCVRTEGEQTECYSKMTSYTTISFLLIIE